MSDGTCVNVDGIIESHLKKGDTNKVIIEKLNKICLYKIDPESCNGVRTKRELKDRIFEELSLQRLVVHRGVLYIYDTLEV